MVGRMVGSGPEIRDNSYVLFGANSILYLRAAEYVVEKQRKLCNQVRRMLAEVIMETTRVEFKVKTKNTKKNTKKLGETTTCCREREQRY